MKNLTPMQKVDANLPNLAKHIEELLFKIAGKNVPFALMVYPDVQGERVRYVSNVSPESARVIVKEMVKQWALEEGRQKKVQFQSLN